MRVVAADVARWRAAGGDAAVARVIAFSGLGGRRAGEVLALGPNGERSGAVLGGAADPAVVLAASRLAPDVASELVEVPIGDPEAVAAGLACGGLARVLVQAAGALPERLWSCLRERRPVALVTVVEGSRAGATSVVEGPAPRDVSGGPIEPPELWTAAFDAAVELLRGGRDASRVVEHGGATALVEAFVPVSRLVVVSEPGGLVQAIAAQAGLLGWETVVHDDVGAAVAAAADLSSGDAIVVLTHDVALDTPVLHEAVGGEAYVGALGSRRTQARRRERLTARGVGEDRLARIHGPVGLDLGSRTPEETALAICAEIVAHRSGRDAASLSAGEGPING